MIHLGRGANKTVLNIIKVVAEREEAIAKLRAQLSEVGSISYVSACNLFGVSCNHVMHYGHYITVLEGSSVELTVDITVVLMDMRRQRGL